MNIVSAKSNVYVFDLSTDYLKDSTIFKIKKEKRDSSKELYDEIAVYYNPKTEDFSRDETSIPIKFQVLRNRIAFSELKSRNICEVLINQYSLVMIRTEYSKIIHNKTNASKDSISSLIMSYYLLPDSTLNEANTNPEITFVWDIADNKKALNEIFSTVFKTYLNSLKAYSIKRFRKDICELSAKELSIIKKNLPFNFNLNLGYDSGYY